MILIALQTGVAKGLLYLRAQQRSIFADPVRWFLTCVQISHYGAPSAMTVWLADMRIRAVRPISPTIIPRRIA